MLKHLLVICTLLICAAETNAEDRRPNLIVIMVDDMGYRDASCYGCIDFTTPNIDALAESGVRMTEGYVSHPYCSPSRAGLMSGRYQQRFGHEHNPPYLEDNNEIGIDKATRLLPDILKEQGYATGLVGKWHLGAGKPFRPAVRGFTEFYGFLGGGHHYFKVDPEGKGYNSPLWRDHAPVADKPTYLTDDLTKEAEAFIDRHKNKPFCLLLMYNAPHSPDHVTDEYMAMVRDIKHPARRRYAALIKGVDMGVGRVRKKLAEKDLTANTIVVFLSDNGGRRGPSDNRPLRGNKGWLHEGGIRVPFIISWQNKLPAGKTYDKPIMSLDLLPTLMAQAKIAVPDGVDGINLMPYLSGQEKGTPHETLYWRVSGGDGYAIRHGDWKLVHDVGMPKAMLYNLATDPGEDKDLSATHPEQFKALSKRYKDWSGRLEKPRWVEGHTGNTTFERNEAKKRGTRQFPMPWALTDEEEASHAD